MRLKTRKKKFDDRERGKKSEERGEGTIMSAVENVREIGRARGIGGAKIVKKHGGGRKGLKCKNKLSKKEKRSKQTDGPHEGLIGGKEKHVINSKRLMPNFSMPKGDGGNKDLGNKCKRMKSLPGVQGKKKKKGAPSAAGKKRKWEGMNSRVFFNAVTSCTSSGMEKKPVDFWAIEKRGAKKGGIRWAARGEGEKGRNHRAESQGVPVERGWAISTKCVHDNASPGVRTRTLRKTNASVESNGRKKHTQKETRLR